MEYGIYNRIQKIDVHCDSRSALEAIVGGKSTNELVIQIRKILEERKIVIKLHWIKAHSGIDKNDKVDKLAKLATERTDIEYEMKYTRKQISVMLKKEGLDKWQIRWNGEDKGRKVFNVFPNVLRSRLKGDFFLNQLITGHGALGPYQQRFFGGNPRCFCGAEVADEVHFVKFRTCSWI